MSKSAEEAIQAIPDDLIETLRSVPCPGTYCPTDSEGKLDDLVEELDMGFEETTPGFVIALGSLLKLVKEGSVMQNNSHVEPVVKQQDDPSK